MASAPVRRARLWVVFGCLALAGLTCSQAFAVDPPATPETTPTATDPPLAASTAPVTTVPTPAPAPAPAARPDPAPVARERKVAPKPATVRKSAPSVAPAVPKARPRTPAPSRPVLRPSAPVRTYRRVTPAPVRTVAPPRVATRSRVRQVVRKRPARKTPAIVPLAVRPEPRDLPPPPPPPSSVEPEPPAPLATESPVAARSATALNVASTDLRRDAAPGVTEQAVDSLRWLFFALLGTAAVFLMAVGSRYLFDDRATENGEGGGRQTPRPPFPTEPGTRTRTLRSAARRPDFRE